MNTFMAFLTNNREHTLLRIDFSGLGMVRGRLRETCMALGPCLQHTFVVIFNIRYHGT